MTARSDNFEHFASLHYTQNDSKVSRLMILNTPLSLNTKLRPGLAEFKSPIPFLRPKTFDATYYNADGLAYVSVNKCSNTT